MTDLIKKVGGIEKAKEIVKDKPYLRHQYFDGFDLYNIEDVRQAISDYNTDHCTNIENHISPSTKVINK
jgi:hypothetical protein